MDCNFPFLGHIVGRAGLECDPNKLSAVANWIPPTTTKGVREFLGFTDITDDSSQITPRLHRPWCICWEQTVSSNGHPLAKTHLKPCAPS